jgi:hypothetical protein
MTASQGPSRAPPRSDTDVQRVPGRSSNSTQRSLDRSIIARRVTLDTIQARRFATFRVPRG